MGKTTIQNLSYLIQNDHRYKYFNQFKAHLSYSREVLLNIQSKYLDKIINHAYYNTHYYRQLFDSIGVTPKDIKTSKDLTLLPPLTKEIIRDKIESIKSSDKYGKNLVKVTSGGSTGNEATIYKSNYCIEVTRGIELRNFLLANWEPSDKSAWIWGSPIEHANAAQSLKVRLGLKVNKRIVLNAFNYSKTDFDIWIEKIHKSNSRVIYGYGGILLDFASHILENNISFTTIKSVISTSEKLNQRDIISQAFNAPVYDQYGCREILGVGIDDSFGNFRIADDNVCLNTTKDNDLLITSLHSFGFPLINYQVGDTAVINPKESSNSPFSELKLDLVRETENFITLHGVFVSSSAIATFISTFSLGLKKYQISQASPIAFKVDYIMGLNSNQRHITTVISNVLKEYFGQDISIEFNSVERIKPEASGKQLMFKRLFKLS